MQKTSFSFKVGFVVIFISSLWTFIFICIGGSASGKKWYNNVSLLLFDDVKSGTIVMNLVLPVLVSGTAASLLTTKCNDQGTSSTYQCCPHYFHRLLRRWNAGETNFKSFSIQFLVIPMVLLVLMTIHRHLYGKELTLDDQIMEISNAFAFMALTCLGLFLVPVAKHGPILKLLNWNPAAAIRLHINAGRLIILGSVLHGGGHVYRWTVLSGEGFWSMLIPPTPCWSFDIGDYTPECIDYETDCTCYDHFRNLIGLTALVCLLVIGITTTNYVRRRYYRIFYLTHILAAPSALLLIIFHWNKSILYMAPSILYNAASSAPVAVEHTCSKSNVTIHSVQTIKSLDGPNLRTCIALTISATELAVQKYAAGQYIKLSVPDLSLVSHPFTINKVPGSSTQLRIIFRVVGRFTHQLAERIQQQSTLSQISVDGYHGSQLRVVQVLQHDVIVMVAAGIGITPYLSVLGDLHDGAITKEVVLHWICREVELIKYIKEEYFDALIANHQTNGIRIRLIVHKTGTNDSRETSVTGLDMERLSDYDVEQALPGEQITTSPFGRPFEPSKFSTGIHTSFLANIPMFLIFGTISWTGLFGIMYLFNTNEAEKAILYRGLAPIFVITLSVLVAILGNFILGCINVELLNTMVLRRGISWSRVSEMVTTAQPPDMSENYPEYSASVTYEERRGRPTVHELLKTLDNGRCPALFSCGPSELAQDLRLAVEEKCLIRIRQCLEGPRIAIHQEAFEL